MASRPQKGKDGKRPRAFHRGRAQGRINEARMTSEVNPAYDRAAADRVDVEATTADHRALVRDHRDLMDGLERAAPFVPCWEFPL